MKLINKVTEESYIQWIEKFVRNVLFRKELTCEEVIIEDIEFSKRIFLNIDGEEYTIRTWNFKPIDADENGETCAEMVEYTLFKMIVDEDGNGHGEEVGDGSFIIEWVNNPK